MGLTQHPGDTMSHSFRSYIIRQRDTCCAESLSLHRVLHVLEAEEFDVPYVYNIEESFHACH